MYPFFGLSSEGKSPYLYSPYFLIDCQKNGEAFQKTCFRHAAYLTRAINETGLFEDILSPSHIYFIENLREGFISFEEKRPYSNSKWRDVILHRYANVFRMTVDESKRFILFSVAEDKELSQEPDYLLQKENLRRALQTYLEARSIPYEFWSQDSASLSFQKFSRLAVYISLRFADEPSLVSLKKELLLLQNELGHLPAVSSSFSGADVWNELQVLWGKRSMPELIKLREFVDESRSLFWQADENSYAIALYQDGHSLALKKEQIEEVIKKYIPPQVQVEISLLPQNFLPVQEQPITPEAIISLLPSHSQ